MKRRLDNSTASLDLFLDTICNAFAAIMFIAILLSIITQMRSSEDTLKKSIDPAVARKNLQRLDELNAKSRTLQSVIEALASQVKRSSSDGQITAEQQRMDESLKRLSSTTANHAKLLLELESLLRGNEHFQRELAVLDEDLKKLRVVAQQRSGDLDTIRTEKTIAIELPRVRSTSKGNIGLLMKHGKCYFAWDSILDIRDSEFIETFDRAGVKYLRPKPSSGWNLEQSVDVAELTQTLRVYSPSLQIATIGVWPDSFAEFANLKKKLIELGYEYELVPLDDVDSIPLGVRDSHAVVQ